MTGPGNGDSTQTQPYGSAIEILGEQHLATKGVLFLKLSESNRDGEQDN